MNLQSLAIHGRLTEADYDAIHNNLLAIHARLHSIDEQASEEFALKCCLTDTDLSVVEVVDLFLDTIAEGE